jgi:hypothetical protein
MNKTIAILLLILFQLAASKPNSDEQRALDAIQQMRLQSHVDFLASDLLEGRGTGTRGYDLAALYVASQFELLGLKPANQNSYYQMIPFRKADLVPEKCSFTVTASGNTKEFRYGEEYVMPSDYIREEVELNAPVVFAGFGVTAPELKYDDYAGLDVKGKVVALIRGGPESFPASRRAHYSSSRIKDKNAVEHGAIGIITMRTPEDEQNSPWPRSVRQSKLSAYRWEDENGKPNEVHEQLRGSATVNRTGADILFAGAPQTLDKVFKSAKNNTLKSFPLPIQVSMKKASKLDEAKSSNVIGLLEGSDPKLKNEYILYTAHLDHLGISDPVDGDSINNGAYDNAVGIASLIELARAFQSLSNKPRRSILFAAVTAEEKGLQGSDYLAHFPPPNANIVANLNTDMFLMIFPFTDVIIFGEDNSTLGASAKKASADAGLIVSPDPAPDEVRFVRSDQYSFVKRGVPSVCITSGFKLGDAKMEGEKITRRWLRTTYHMPQDDSSQKMEWSSGIKLIRANFLTGLRVANADQRPAWNSGDFFGALFSPQSRGDTEK